MAHVQVYCWLIRNMPLLPLCRFSVHVYRHAPAYAFFVYMPACVVGLCLCAGLRCGYVSECVLVSSQGRAGQGIPTWINHHSLIKWKADQAECWER